MFIGDSDTKQEASVEPRTKTPTGNALNVQIGPGDPISNIPVVMDFQHHQGHEGESFVVQHYSANPATIEFALAVPSYANPLDVPHLTIQLQVYNGAMQVDVYEGATHTGGVVMPSFNRRRNSLNTPGMVIRSGVANTGAGVLLPHSFIVSSAGKQGGTNRIADEIMLKANTEYRVVLEEISATTRCILNFDWYEDLGE